jgi:hypothetical protein
MDKMGWQKHTVRGFMAGAAKKADARPRPSSLRAASAPTERVASNLSPACPNAKSPEPWPKLQRAAT